MSEQAQKAIRELKEILEKLEKAEEGEKKRGVLPPPVPVKKLEEYIEGLEDKLVVDTELGPMARFFFVDAIIPSQELFMKKEVKTYTDKATGQPVVEIITKSIAPPEVIQKISSLRTKIFRIYRDKGLVNLRQGDWVAFDLDTAKEVANTIENAIKQAILFDKLVVEALRQKYGENWREIVNILLEEKYKPIISIELIPLDIAIYYLRRAKSLVTDALVEAKRKLEEEKKDRRKYAERKRIVLKWEKILSKIDNMLKKLEEEEAKRKRIRTMYQRS